ncbi:MAG: P-loop NTPase fold protein [Saprospiraceae bacterium]
MKKLKPYLIGITGGSGSGKTSFIKKLRSIYSENEVCIISQDNFYHPHQFQMKDASGIVNYDLPGSIDQKKFSYYLKELIKGKPIELKEYTFNTQKNKGNMLLFKPAPVIIVEGIFIFHNKLINSLLDLKVFIEAKENLKVIRRIKRDQIERELPLEMVLYQYEKHVLPAFEKYILPFKDEVDIVINNNQNFSAAIELMTGFIDSKLTAK